MDIKNILPSRLFDATEKAGINTLKQIIVCSHWDIKKLTNLRDEDILLLKNIVTQYCCPVIYTSDKLEIQDDKLKTGCKNIDTILNGGLRRGTLTEIYGESGVGKTQIALQIACQSENDGSVFICTEDMFPLKRFNQIKQHISKAKGIKSDENVFIEHLTEAHELISCIRIHLLKLLSAKNVSLVVLDSVAGPFRCEYSNYVQRAEELREIGVLLYKLAQEFNIAVICINQVTSSFDNSDNVLPSLGLVWANMISNKIKIKKSVNIFTNQYVIIRELQIVNSPDLPTAIAKFIITERGLQDIT